MVKLTPQQQERLTRSGPVTFRPVNGAWGRSGSTLVALADADPATVAATVALSRSNLPP